MKIVKRVEWAVNSANIPPRAAIDAAKANNGLLIAERNANMPFVIFRFSGKNQ